MGLAISTSLSSCLGIEIRGLNFVEPFDGDDLKKIVGTV